MERYNYLCVCNSARELIYVYRLLADVLHKAGDDIYCVDQSFMFDRTQRATIRFVHWRRVEEARQGFRGKEMNGRWLEKQIDNGLICNFSDIDICIKKSEEEAKQYWMEVFNGTY